MVSAPGPPRSTEVEEVKLVMESLPAPASTEIWVTPLPSQASLASPAATQPGPGVRLASSSSTTIQPPSYQETLTSFRSLPPATVSVPSATPAVVVASAGAGESAATAQAAAAAASARHVLPAG